MADVKLESLRIREGDEIDVARHAEDYEDTIKDPDEITVRFLDPSNGEATIEDLIDALKALRRDLRKVAAEDHPPKPDSYRWDECICEIRDTAGPTYRVHEELDCPVPGHGDRSVEVGDLGG